MYQLVAKTEELSKSMKPIYKLQEQMYPFQCIVMLSNEVHFFFFFFFFFFFGRAIFESYILFPECKQLYDAWNNLEELFSC